MNERPESEPTSAPPPVISAILAALPAGSESQTIRFAQAPEAGQTIVATFPASLRCWALLETKPVETLTPDRISVLTVPWDNPTDEQVLHIARSWVEESVSADQPPALTMTLQGTVVVTAASRFAILGPAQRLPQLRRALVQVVYYERELARVERRVSESWSEWESDIPLGVEFGERELLRREELGARYREVMALEARLARLSPEVHRPHVHPPTLASQVQERFRERHQMAHRHEIVAEQVEVFRDLYETCSQRLNEFRLTRSSLKLEWAIIVLLGFQILLSLFEILSSLES